MSVAGPSEDVQTRGIDRDSPVFRLSPSLSDRVNMDLNLALLLRVVRRRKWTLILSVVSAIALTMVALSQIVPKYTATLELIIEPKQINIIDLESIIAQVPPDADLIASQIEIIRSRDLAGKVIDRLSLDELPEFNPMLREATMLDEAIDALKARVRSWLGEQDLPVETPPEDRERTMIVNEFRGALDVRLRGNSRVVAISFTSVDRELAPMVANAVVDMYLVDQLEAKFHAISRASSWLNDRLVTLRAQVEDSENAVETYRAQAGLIEGVNSSVVTEQISALSAQLIQARAAQAQAESRLAQARAFAPGAGALQYVPEVLQSPVVQQLWQEQAALSRQEADLSGKFGQQHPQLITLRAQIAEVNRRVDQEVQRVVRSLESAAGAARTETASLQRQLNELQETATQYDIAEARLRALRREAETSQKMLQVFLERSMQSGDLVELEEPDARILSRASLPLGPSYPNRKLTLAAALGGSVMLGLLLMYLQEKLDQTFRSGEDVENLVRLPCLALVPMVASVRRRHALLEYVINKPTSVFAEAIRLLRTSLWLHRGSEGPSGRPKCVAITSSKPAESKTSTAVSLARAAAHAGERVMLIDCDVRMPTVAEAFKASSGAGLMELLSGAAYRREAIQRDYASPLDFIPAGAISSNSAKLLMSDAMLELLNDLRKEYDLIVLDSPPALAISDARIIARIADAVIYCVRWRDTSRSAVTNGLKVLMESGAHVIGVALTQVDMKAHARSGYSDAYFYSKPYVGYFNN
ncbi:MAG: hypothetical protein BroJett029_27430 [Alphaproteobacteria bacterium]|nr:MAG: hypothetical protein BroJett029_27430 [Alphaproteobacteria bacterium]